MHFGFITLVKMNKTGYHLKMLFNFPFSKNGFFFKMLQKTLNIRYWLIFIQINRNIFFQVISLLTNFSWVTVWKKYHFNIFNINNIREGGKLRKNGGAHSTLDISIVNIVMEFCFFVCVRLDWLVHTDIVCKESFLFLY